MADVIYSYKGMKVFMQLSPGWAKQFKRIGITLIDDVGGIEKFKSVSDEEYEDVKAMAFSY